MAYQTFSWLPDSASVVSIEPTVNVTKFGDGYESRVADVINTVKRSWACVFTKGRVDGEAVAINNFLRARRAVEAFIWVDPLGETGVWVCRKWTLKTDRGELVVTATFEEVFESV